MAAIRDSYNKKTSAGTGESEVAAIRAKVLEQERYLTLLQSQGVDAQKLTEGEKLVIKIQEELKTSISGAARAQKEKALAAAESLAAVDKQIIAEQAHAKAIADSEAAYRKDIAAMASRTDDIEKQAQALEDANASFGKSKIAIEAETIAREQRRLAMLQSLGLEGATTEELEREIKARDPFPFPGGCTEQIPQQVGFAQDSGAADRFQTLIPPLAYALAGDL